MQELKERRLCRLVPAVRAIFWRELETDSASVEIISYKDLQRHSGFMKDANTICFVYGKIGDDAWVSRSTCRRKG